MFATIARRPAVAAAQSDSPTAARKRRLTARLGAQLKAVAVCVVAAGAIGGLAASPAHAASRLSACFSYGGQRYQNLSTNVLFKNTAGGWTFLANSAGHTRSDGCVIYNISGRVQNWSLQVRATGAVPNWRGVFNGFTPTFAPAGQGSYYLGEGRLAFYYLPASAPTPPDNRNMTSNWLDSMSSGSNGSGCSNNAALVVTCWMDANGMHGNVIVQDRDSDHDGYIDAQDRYPQNKYYR